MKEAFVNKELKVEIRDSPIPKAKPGQLIIQVVFSGSNPKDWKGPVMGGATINSGDDIAGYVHEVGEGVTEFKKGDKVAAFHEMRTSGGSFAEYAVAWAHTTFFLPEKTSFEEGAALPLAAMTAALGMFASDRLDLGAPWAPASKSIPLVIYGASSAVGSYALQFAQRANIHPVIAVAGRAQDHVKSFLKPDKGDVVLDYRKGEDAIAQGIKDALNGAKLEHAFDAVSEKGSYQTIIKVLEPDGAITLVLPFKDYPEIPKTAKQSLTMVGDVHGKNKDFGYVYFRWLTLALEEGWFKPQPHEVVPGGLEGIASGLGRLQDGTASAVKYVFKVADTPGAGSGS